MFLNLRFVRWKNISISILLFSVASILLTEKDNSLQVMAQEIIHNVTVEEINEKAERLLGQTVTVKGAIEEIKSGSAFTIEDERYFSAERILVINRSNESLPELPERDIPIQVTGKIDKLERAQIVRNQDLDLSPDIVAVFQERPVIYADTIVLAPDPDEVTEDPQSYYGRQVAVQGKVEEILGANAFTLAEDKLKEGKNLLVLNLVAEPMPAEGEKVLVTGMVRSFNATELEQDYDLNGERQLPRELETEYSQQVVLIVDSIQPSNFDASEPELDLERKLVP
ncbi:hypothetical protein IQ238_22560 [Pleurocapsales cyanobacterium LEGE 06147]|nr:hypothetical protein [Pleurocapsales cyanobacterium LEGE 06147]